MVRRQAPDSFPVQKIAPAVAYIGNNRHLMIHIGRHQSGAHALKVLKLPGLVIDGKIGQTHRFPEHLPCLLLAHPRLAEAGHLLHEYLQSQGAGHITGFGPAHAVTDGAEQAVFFKCMHPICILVLDPDTAGICQSPRLHGRTSLPCLFKLYQFFPGIAIISAEIDMENSPCTPIFPLLAM